MSHTHIIGIDPATQTGWAVLDMAGNRVASGTLSFKSKRHEGGGMRFLRARKAFMDLHSAYPDAIWAYEEVARHRGVAAAHVYGGLVAALQTVLEESGRPYAGHAVGAVKKVATGKGNAKKPAMIAAANERWGITVADDNEADALWVAEAARLEVAA